MKRLTLAIDCDDVLVSSTEQIVLMYNQMYGTEVTLENAHTKDNPEWRADRKTTLQRIYDIQLSEVYAQTQPFMTAIKSIKNLSVYHELHLVTARPELIMSVTEKMISKYFPSSFTSLHHVGEGKAKGEVCKRIGADMLIDDNEKHLVSASNFGLGGLVWFGDYPWNQTTSTPAGVVRCAIWAEVEREVERAANR